MGAFSCLSDWLEQSLPRRYRHFLRKFPFCFCPPCLLLLCFFGKMPVQGFFVIFGALPCYVSSFEVK